MKLFIQLVTEETGECRYLSRDPKESFTSNIEDALVVRSVEAAFDAGFDLVIKWAEDAFGVGNGVDRLCMKKGEKLLVQRRMKDGSLRTVIRFTHNLDLPVKFNRLTNFKKIEDTTRVAMLGKPRLVRRVKEV